MSSDTILIRISRDLAAAFGTRTEDGRRLSFNLGEPTGHCPDGDEYIYTPTVTVTDDGTHCCRCSRPDAHSVYLVRLPVVEIGGAR